MSKLYQILKAPLLTEKLNNLKESNNQIAFEVDHRANKTEIKHAIEKFFKVKVASINTCMVHGKVKTMGRKFAGRESNWKKAIVTLKSGQKIDFVEGV